MNLIPDGTRIDDKMRKQVLEASVKGVKEFLISYMRCCKALEKTFEYVYEGDLQAALYNSIKGNLENCKWSYGKKEWGISNSKKDPIKTNKPCLVHCEQWYRYKHNGKIRGKFIDIAIWDPTKKNSEKSYLDEDLLLLIELKYRFQAKNILEAVKEDCKKLIDLKLKGYQKGLALTFTVAYRESVKAELQKSRESFELVDDVHEILNEKQLRENPIQAFVVCRDGIIEDTSSTRK